jgi:urea carboxylase
MAEPGVAPLLESVLVANRGEIAVRIIRTLRRLGIRSLAVYSDADRDARHVLDADEAVRLGPAPAAESYLDVDRILDAARKLSAAAIHPGYGFLSEDADFAAEVEAAGLAFIGPTPDQIRQFGDKHTARMLAEQAGVPLVAGTGLLTDADAALAAAEAIGYPVMLKSTGGGGGIGMLACDGPGELAEGFTRVKRLGEASFRSSGVYLERLVRRARHIEVQVFGDGTGSVMTLGGRDCSLQRRHQKVVEESPPPNLASGQLDELVDHAHRLAASVRYRSAGTVEFVIDADRGEASFLEVNTRLQVEHPVTEATHDVDLVEWMVRLAGGDRRFVVDRARPAGHGHAVEVRVYAEDPSHDHRPNSGRLTEVSFPAGTRVDGWVETGTDITPSYDPLLAKVITQGPDRTTALERMRRALAGTRIAGIETNVGFVRELLATDAVASGTYETGTLGAFRVSAPTVEVLRPGRMTTVQDLPGREGFWSVGVPPSGPMDDRSFGLGNVALGNDEGAPGLELTLDGPSLRFGTDAVVCLTGAEMPATVDGQPVPWWTPTPIAAGAVLDVGPSTGPGLRAYLLVQGGFDVPAYLGSRSTFTLGGFGGHGGRALRAGDVLHIASSASSSTSGVSGPVAPIDRPSLTHEWHIGVLEGPHAAPEFFTPADIDTFYGTAYTVHHNSSRTGVRLIGPKPQWARPDGGEAGLHPSNIHDTAYAVGTVDFTGDMPIVLGPDGPSLGGFVCPATVVAEERWKLGQLRPGDQVRFTPIGGSPPAATGRSTGVELVARRDPTGGVLGRLERDDNAGRPAVCYRRAGSSHLLVEYGPMVLDLALRLRVHALAAWITEHRLAGVVDLTPGIRSLQVQLDPSVVTVERLAGILQAAEDELPDVTTLAVPSREVHLPLSWDDPATREAIRRYMASVRDDAPWCPWNIEFIRRVNGLVSVDDVFRIVHDATYLVLGLGDVYLGAPVATPLDPRHRLVTTKYNPARTWTPENAVGIGGAYLCIYGMEGPGGYQFVGRTVPVWNTYRTTKHFEPGHPWLLRFFDRIRWYEVTADELLDLRADLRAGRAELRITDGTFRLDDHERSLAAESASIDAFRARQQAAFAAERAAWEAAGEFDARPEPDPPPPPGPVEVPAGGCVVEAGLTASVWRIDAVPGAAVETGDALVALEAMKTEVVVTAPRRGVVHRVVASIGQQVDPGSPLVILAAAS